MYHITIFFGFFILISLVQSVDIIENGWSAEEIACINGMCQTEWDNALLNSDAKEYLDCMEFCDPLDDVCGYYCYMDFAIYNPGVMDLFDCLYDCLPKNEFLQSI